MGFAETANLAVRIDLEGNAAAGVAGLNRQVKGLGASVGRVGKGFGQIGAGVARAGLFVGGAAVAGIGAATKAFIDFEDAFAGVVKTVDETELRKAGLTFEGLATSFRDMATEIPIAATEFARLGEAAGALGVDAKDIETFVEVTAKLGVTTDLTADQAADALGRIGTILDFTGKEYVAFADSLVALGNAGASTESEIIEITKRFASEGKAAGLATEDIAGLASATASLGFAPERGGTALSRVFANLATNISLANSKGKAFASVTGRSVTDLQNALDRGDGLTIFTDFLKGLKGLSATDAARVLKAAGITNTSDRNIFRTMAGQLPFVNDQLEIAKDATGALAEEATKKFATTASKIQLFKNNLIESGITFGQEVAPAVNRALDKIITALKDPVFKSGLKQLGQDVGKAIDSIDWKSVLDGGREFVGVLKSALSFSMTILETLNKLPTEIKAAALGFLALNKVSGGLIGAGVGNVVGGLAGAAAQGLASRAPIVGRLFAQPVFVTNFPLGFGGGLGAGGAGGAAAALGGAGAAATVASVAAAALAVAGVIVTQQHFSNQSTGQAAAIKEGLDASIAGKSLPELNAALAGVQQGIQRIQSNPLLALVQGEALTTLQAMEADLKTAIANPTNALGGQSTQDLDPNTRQWRNDNPDRTKEIAEERKQNAKLEALHYQANRNKDDTIAGIGETTRAALETKRETGRGASIVSTATRTGSGNIVSAIYANRPVTNVSVNVSSTSITKVTTTNARYGRNTGSGGQNQVRPA